MIRNKNPTGAELQDIFKVRSGFNTNAESLEIKDFWDTRNATRFSVHRDIKPIGTNKKAQGAVSPVWRTIILVTLMVLLFLAIAYIVRRMLPQ